MSSDGTWEVVATPSERWWLSIFLLRNDLKFKGKKETSLWRFRCALGLVEPSEAFLQVKGAGSVALALDRTTKNTFIVTDERAEFISDCIEQVDANGAELMMFQRILAQLREKAPSPDVAQATPYDPAAEDWAPTLAPVVQQPGKLVDVLVDCLAAEDFGTFKKRFLEEATPQKPGKPAGRLAETATA